MSRGKPIKIVAPDGTEYSSLREAAKHLPYSMTALRRRLELNIPLDIPMDSVAEQNRLNSQASPYRKWVVNGNPTKDQRYHVIKKIVEGKSTPLK